MTRAAVEEDSILRVVLPTAVKHEFREKCTSSGQNMSERARQLIIRDLEKPASPAQRLSAVLASAEEKARASELPELTIDDIDAFIDEVRDERIAHGHVS